jgi:transcriptional antiterminator RfaH
MSYWCAAQLQSRREHTALHVLEQAGFEVDLPRLRERRTRYGRRIEVLTALFPTYAFVRLVAQWHAARWAPGVTRLIMDGDHPARLPDEAITEIRARERNGAVELPKRELRHGDPVRILHGAFVGRLGLYSGMAPHERVMVLLQLLGAARRIKLRKDAIEPA